MVQKNCTIPAGLCHFQGILSTLQKSESGFFRMLLHQLLHQLAFSECCNYLFYLVGCEGIEPTTR